MENLLNKKLIFQTDFSQNNAIDSAEKQKSYLIVTKSGKHLKVSPTSYYLLENIDKGVTPQQLAEMLDVPVEKINNSYESLVEKINLFDNNESNRRTGFWFLWEIIPSRFVSLIAQPLSLMYQPVIAGFMVLLIVAGIIFNIQLGTFTTSFSSINNPEAFWIGYFLFLLSTVAHEFGHASASVRYGATPSGIGFTLYLIFPALYSDVTSSWKLKSKQRAVVGLGGIYFQLIFAAFYTLIGFAFGNDAFKIATLMIFGNCILNLNPFFKFDGYWILSDLLGVVNLSQQPKQTLSFIYKRLRGIKTTNLPWSGRISLFVGIYSISSIFIVAFIIFRYSSYFLTGIQNYPPIFQNFFSKVFSQESISFAEIHTFFLSTVTLLIFVYFLYNIALKTLIRKLKPI